MTAAPPDTRPDPRIRDLAPFLNAIFDKPIDAAIRLVFCDYLEETGHPAAEEARSAVGEPGQFLSLFAYSLAAHPGMRHVVDCPLLPEWWPVVVFGSPAAPDRLRVNPVPFALRFVLMFVGAEAEAKTLVTLDPSNAGIDWYPPWPGRIINPSGWMVLWGRSEELASVRLTVDTAGPLLFNTNPLPD